MPDKVYFNVDDNGQIVSRWTLFVAGLQDRGMSPSDALTAAWQQRPALYEEHENMRAAFLERTPAVMSILSPAERFAVDAALADYGRGGVETFAEGYEHSATAVSLARQIIGGRWTENDESLLREAVQFTVDKARDPENVNAGPHVVAAGLSMGKDLASKHKYVKHQDIAPDGKVLDVMSDFDSVVARVLVDEFGGDPAMYPEAHERAGLLHPNLARAYATATRRGGGR